MRNNVARVTRFCWRHLGYGREVVMLGHTPVLVDYSDVDNDSVPVYHPDDWRACEGASMIVNLINSVARLDGWGKVSTVHKIRYPRCPSEAARFVKLWKKAAGYPTKPSGRLRGA